MYYNLVGKKVVPCKMHEMSTDINFVAKDEINDAVVSTVFLRIDHNFSDGPPILFETMVFGGKFDEYVQRYSTYDDANIGHKSIINMILFDGLDEKEEKEDFKMSNVVFGESSRNLDI